MKLEKNKKYITIALYAFIVGAALISFIFFLLFPQKLLGAIGKLISVTMPIILGFVKKS